MIKKSKGNIPMIFILEKIWALLDTF